MNGLNINRMKFFLLVFVVFFFSSCGVQISLKSSDVGAEFNLSIDIGNAFLETISGALGIENGSVFALFDTEELRSVLSEADFYDVSVQFESERKMKISGKFDWNSNNPLVLSKIVNPLQNRAALLIFSAENLQTLYALLPRDFKNYLDMFMAPSFTGEEMNDDEYMDLLASVYGDRLVEELKSAMITVTMLNGGAQPTEKNIPLLKILNISGELRM